MPGGNDSASSQSSSADHARAPRARARLSCKQCRERKLKCDRQNPCRACIARGQANSCTFYISDPNRRFVAMRDHVQQLSSQIDNLQNQLLQQAAYQFQASSAFQVDESARPRSQAPSSLQWNLIERLIERTCGSHAHYRFPWLRNILVPGLDAASVLGSAAIACAKASSAAESGDRALLDESLSPYITGLNQLQTAFGSEHAMDRQTLHAASLLSFYELLAHERPFGWYQHLSGVGRLIESRGPQLHIEGTENNNFRFYRGVAITLDLARRQPSFIADVAWKSVPWSKAYPSKDVVDMVEDVLVDIPSLLQESDTLGQPDVDPVESTKRQALLLQQTQTLTSSLEDLRHKWILSYPALQERVAGIGTVDHGILEGIVAQLAPTEPLLAEAVCRYYAAHILLLQIEQGLPSSRFLSAPALASSICTVIETQLTGAQLDYMTALSMTLPLWVVMSVAADQVPELQLRVTQIWQRLREGHGIIFAGREIDQIGSPVSEWDTQSPTGETMS